MPRRKCRMTDQDLRDWIMSNHIVNETGCWIWNGGKNSAGYGCYGRNNRMYLVHRFSLENKIGRCLTTREDARHVCPGLPNRACYNPHHLDVGSRKENMQDMVRVGRSQPGVKNYHSKLTDKDILCIRSLRGMLLLRELAELYEVDQALISMIVNRKIWKHVA